jgi:PAS domain S-box-containing protein
MEETLPSQPAHKGDKLARDRSEAALRESERLFRATFDRAPIGIAHIAHDGRWLRINRRLGDILGYRREELAARSIQDLTYPDDLDAELAYIQRLLAGEIDEYAIEQRHVRKDGALVWTHGTVSLVRTPEGEPDYFIAMLQDITERKLLEQDRARLLEQEQAARAEAEATNAQLRAMQALTDTALSQLALDDLLRELLDRVTAMMGVDHVAILLLDEDDRTLTVRAARGRLGPALDRVRVLLGQGVAGRIAANREPLIENDLATSDLTGVHPLLREQMHSVVGVPLLVEDPVEDACAGQLVSRLVGVLQVGSITPRRFTEADVQLLQRAADRISLAINRAHLYAAEQDARQRAEAALARATASEARAAERAEQLHTILETIADGVAVSATDGRLIQTNRAFRELLAADHLPQFDVMTFVDRAPLFDFHDPATGEPFPIERHPVARALRGEVVRGPEADVRMRTLDGHELEVNISAAPLRDREPDGRVVGAVSVVRDVTWRKQLEREREAARVQAERQADELDRVFEATAEGMLVWDADGRLVQVNPAARRMLGLDAAPPGYSRLPLRERLALYAARDEQGRPVPAEEWPVMRTLRAEAGTGTRRETRDFQMRALDGREIEINMSAAPLRDRDGRGVGAVTVLHDQTERKQLEREREAARADELVAREASRRLEEFLATAVHDLRSPLAATVGYIDLAERQAARLASAVQEASPDLAPKAEAVRHRLDDAGAGATRLSRLLTLLFDTAAIRAGTLELHRAPCDLAALVRDQVAELRVTAPDRTIRLRAPAGGALFLVEADADRIGQVVMNYVTNALKYSPPDQPVDVSVVARGGRARVTVCDRGPGIPKEERARVWELFHRAPGIAAQGGAQGGARGGSLGLGLHIAKAIITAHGGRIGVKSVVGEGSTFWFTLPLSRRDGGEHIGRTPEESHTKQQSLRPRGSRSAPHQPARPEKPLPSFGERQA